MLSSSSLDWLIWFFLFSVVLGSWVKAVNRWMKKGKPILQSSCRVSFHGNEGKACALSAAICNSSTWNTRDEQQQKKMKKESSVWDLNEFKQRDRYRCFIQLSWLGIVHVITSRGRLSSCSVAPLLFSRDKKNYEENVAKIFLFIYLQGY